MLLTGPRAELRPLAPWMAEEFLAHIDRARATVNPWSPWAARSTDLASATATLESFAARQAADTGQLHGIWLHDTLVGGAMFVRFDADAGNCELGVWTEPAGSGRGLVTAAVRHLLDYAFSARGMRRAEWITTASNVPSRALAQRLGMRLDGVLRSEYFHNGQRLDSEVWSLLSEEWGRQQAAGQPICSLERRGLPPAPGFQASSAEGGAG
jgi:RimJ/RimL family protein N-acetyltransferase